MRIIGGRGGSWSSGIVHAVLAQPVLGKRKKVWILPGGMHLFTSAINDCTFACGTLSLMALIYRSRWGAVMANLVVRNLDQRIVDALKQRAARHGRSAEAEHRALLEALLLQPKGKSFAEALTGMPNVGQDEDFERLEDGAGNDHVFG